MTLCQLRQLTGWELESSEDSLLTSLSLGRKTQNRAEPGGVPWASLSPCDVSTWPFQHAASGEVAFSSVNSEFPQSVDCLL